MKRMDKDRISWMPGDLYLILKLDISLLTNRDPIVTYKHNSMDDLHRLHSLGSRRQRFNLTRPKDQYKVNTPTLVSR
jgi:hypothetical protein